MILELGETIMAILGFMIIIGFLVAPELIFVVILVSIIGLIGFSTTGNELTIKSKDHIILQLNVDKDANTTKVDIGENK